MKKLQIILLIITLVPIFSVDYLALSDPCNWKVVCPDRAGFNRSELIRFPNFYIPVISGGLANQIYIPAHWSVSYFVIDVIVLFFINFVIYLILKLWQKLR